MCLLGYVRCEPSSLYGCLAGQPRFAPIPPKYVVDLQILQVQYVLKAPMSPLVNSQSVNVSVKVRQVRSLIGPYPSCDAWLASPDLLLFPKICDSQILQVLKARSTGSYAPLLNFVYKGTY